MSFKVPEAFRITTERAEKFSWITNRLSIFVTTSATHGNNGAFLIPREGKSANTAYYFAVASNGLNWEHVSVHIPGVSQCPSWEEMCYIKSLFWEDEDCVVQYHPPKSMYVNNHEHTLHLWRPTAQPLPVPDTILVGFKKANA
jgi:hypothetical protein